jgi:non-heme chloroperoxidase
MTPTLPRTGTHAITGHEAQQLQRANATGQQPVMFVHGLWLLASSWDRWAAVFEEAGYVTLTPGWPDDPETVAAAKASPDVFARKTVGQVADHLERIARQLARKPVIIGHSFGGMLAQMLAGRGCSAATVAIDPAPFQGVLPLPLSTLRASWPVLGNPFNRNRAVSLTFAQFRFAFANAVSENEARTLYENFAVPAPARPLFQAATANFNPFSEVKVDARSSMRGPLLVISGEKDHVVPRAISHAAYRKQQRNGGTTEFVEMPNRGHALTIDSGWRAVANTALAFAQRFVPAARQPSTA